MAPPLETAPATDDASSGDTFELLKQQLELDISFCPRQIKGKTTFDIQPRKAQLSEIVFNARQLKPMHITVEGHKASFNYSNLHQRMTLYPGTDLGQYHFPKDRIQRHVNEGEDELVVHLPDSVRIRAVPPEEAGQAADAQGPFYAPLKIEVTYVLDDFRDGLHFAGVEDGDSRFPHAYTRNSPFPGAASSLFPCIDDGETRCPFDVSIRYPRTMGDALSKHAPATSATQAQTNGVDKADSVMSDVDDDAGFSDEEKAMEMQVICSGVLTDDIVDPTDSSRKTASFTCESLVLPQHVGFVVGPFEHVDLSDFRDLADEERLAESAIKVHAFCLPGREEEVRNSAMMLARALDSFTERFQSYAFGNAYKLAFVDDLDCDTSHTASFSICSSRLLFPETVWEPLEHTTRVLVHAVASQWIGVDVIAKEIWDYWIIVGASWFMAELYLRELFGRNDWRFRQKLMVDKVIQMDRKRPSLQRLGQYLQLDHAEQEFMELKSLMVLSILHNRLVKQSGKNGVDRCLYRLLFNARQGKYGNGAAITTDDFLDICEKVGHQKLDSFFSQWVEGSGCPNFECFPSFNKKKQVVQLQIRQIQADSTVTTIESALSADEFMREAKESAHGFIPGNEYPTFVGPMTIRIHEADGTPYEHIVDINSSNVKVEIPYNTKYKRLKRNRLNKERMAAAAGLDASGDSQEDVTFYMLGDVFGTAQEQDEWRLSDWPPEDEAKMEQEAYEWIRIDADFEWICRAHINDMPSYMYVSQLQQDKDVVAQYESIQFLASKEGHKLISTFLVKTLMDTRYFHGIRTFAADVMAQSALKRTEWTGLFHLKKAFRELFCLPGSPMTRSNDFSDRSLYLIQCAIPKAIAKIKGEDGRAPLEAKRFLLDIIRYNDNRGNEYSDDYYISTLMHCLADCLITNKNGDMDMDVETERHEFEFTKKAIEELTRHQRLDEWIPTYQNVYTTTALDCARKLVMNRVTPYKPTEFLQYAQLGNADNVRLKAWDCLVQLGMLRKDHVLDFMLHEIRSDPSPYFRKQLLRVFSFAIGQIATGDVYIQEKPVESSLGSLVVENEADSSDRASQLARQSLNGAQRGLKTDLQNNQTLRKALEEALKSKVLSVSDMLELLDFCNMVFDHLKRNTLVVTLHKPRFWKLFHLGQGKFRFTQTGEFRKNPSSKFIAPNRPVAPAVAAAPVQPKPISVAPQGLPPLAVPKPKLSLKLGRSAASPPSSAIDTGAPKSRQQSIMLSPAAVNSPQPIPESAKATPAPTPSASKPESKTATPQISSPSVVAPQSKPATPAPVVQTPVPAPPPPAAAPRPTPAAVNIPTGISTPPAINSPIPLPTTTTKLKIKTKVGPASASSPRPSAAPSPRPSAAPSPQPSAANSPRPSAAPSSRPTPKHTGITIKAPTPTSSASSVTLAAATPKSSKKKSKIVKLALRPELLARFNKKRKLAPDDSDRPSKRQSLEPNGFLNRSGSGSPKSGLVSVDRSGGRLLLKMSFGKGKMEGK